MVKISRKILTIVSIALLSVGCDLRPPESIDDSAVVAQVGDVEFTVKELKETMPQGLVVGDSVAYAKLQIDKWVLKQLKLREAELMFEESAEDVERKVEAYRQSLLIRKLDDHYMAGVSDSLPTSQDIEAYYNANKSDFKLDRTLVKGRVVQFPKEYRKSATLKKLFVSDKEQDINELKDVVQKNGLEMEDLSQDWVDINYFIDRLPVRGMSNSSSLLKSEGVQTMYGASYNYYYEIESVLRPGDPAPLERVAEVIEKILVNERQGERIEQGERALFDAAQVNGDVKIFEFN